MGIRQVLQSCMVASEDEKGLLECVLEYIGCTEDQAVEEVIDVVQDTQLINEVVNFRGTHAMDEFVATLTPIAQYSPEVASAVKSLMGFRMGVIELEPRTQHRCLQYSDALEISSLKEHGKFEEFEYRWFPEGTGELVVDEIANSIAKLKKQAPEGEQPIGKSIKCRLGPFISECVWTNVGGPEITRQDIEQGCFNKCTIDLIIGVPAPEVNIFDGRPEALQKGLKLNVTMKQRFCIIKTANQ